MTQRGPWEVKKRLSVLFGENYNRVKSQGKCECRLKRQSQARMNAPAPNPSQEFLEKLGAEKEDTKKWFYLIPFSRILLETVAAAGSALRDAAELARPYNCL